jgi:CTP:molybdopterin cytidylyltransferase MocA
MSENDAIKRLYHASIKLMVGTVGTIILAAGGTFFYWQKQLAEHETRITHAEEAIRKKADENIVVYRLDKIERQNDWIIDSLTKRQK